MNLIPEALAKPHLRSGHDPTDAGWPSKPFLRKPWRSIRGRRPPSIFRAVRRELGGFARASPGVLLCGTMLAFALSAIADTNTPVWRLTFDEMPAGWKVKTKPGTASAVFAVVDCPEAARHKALNMEANKASASLTGEIKDVDLNATPIMRWSWRVTMFPDGADGRDSGKDDQAIGVYLGSGGFLSQKSMAYRWETDTPLGTNGQAAYAAGVVKVVWHCLRNRQDGTNGAFLVEERNVADDYRAAFGSTPGKFGLSISCNSQYTGTKAAAQLEWIEFCAATNAVAADASDR